MTLGRKRKLVDDVRREWQVSIRRTCAALKFDEPTKPRPGQVSLEHPSDVSLR
jgi:putative transposase